MKGFQAYWTFGHTRARYFPPENGGLIPRERRWPAACSASTTTRRFNRPVNLRYQHKNAEWIAFTIALRQRAGSERRARCRRRAGGLRRNQQVTIGLACNGVFATVANPLSDCVSPGGAMGKVTSKLLTLPQGGYDGFPSQENDDHNPDRVKPRNVFNLGIGTDNLLHREGKRRYTASIEIANLTNVCALQFPLDFQRHPLPAAQVIGGENRDDVLGRNHPRPAALTDAPNRPL